MKDNKVDHGTKIKSYDEYLEKVTIKKIEKAASKYYKIGVMTATMASANLKKTNQQS